MDDRDQASKPHRKTARKGAFRREDPEHLSTFKLDRIHTRLESTFSYLREELRDVPWTELADDELDAVKRLEHLVTNIDAKYAGDDFLSTRDAFVSAPERARLAVVKWLGAETRNLTTNNRLTFRTCEFRVRYKKRGEAKLKWASSAEVLRIARGFVADCIGSSPDVVVASGFTGGASTRVKRSVYASSTKFEGRLHATVDAAEHLIDRVSTDTLESWMRLNGELLDPVYVDGSEMFTVPKNARIDRVACKEPEMNMYLQRAYGDQIRAALKRRGVDLNDQRVNQRLARKGSVQAMRGMKNPLVTIDLSSASDTISTVLVKLLLPKEWFECLDACRVKQTLLPDGTWHELQMFSSMGNGFTFELESLIFWALTRACSYILRSAGRISVYGDDIICPQDVGLMLTRVFPWFGFSLNKSKSCFGGRKNPFRESCGSWWEGEVDVTPLYYRSRVSSLSEVIQVANQLGGWLTGRPADYPLRSELYRPLHVLWKHLAMSIPKRLWGGQSHERIDALVTGHAARHVLVRVLSKRMRVQVRKTAPELGAYIRWHHEQVRIGDLDFPGGRRFFVTTWEEAFKWAHQLGDRKILADRCEADRPITSPTEPAAGELTGMWVVKPNESEYRTEYLAPFKLLWKRSGQPAHTEGGWWEITRKGSHSVYYPHVPGTPGHPRTQLALEAFIGSN